MAGMMLGDFGADVVKVEQPGANFGKTKSSVDLGSCRQGAEPELIEDRHGCAGNRLTVRANNGSADRCGLLLRGSCQFSEEQDQRNKPQRNSSLQPPTCCQGQANGGALVSFRFIACPPLPKDHQWHRHTCAAYC